MIEDETIFANINNKTEITKWYSISGASAMRSSKDRWIVPMTARFVFEDGDCKSLFLSGKLVLVDSSVGDRVESIQEMMIWNQSIWPAWLHNLYQLACRDLQADLMVAAAS
jgi:hypothetical protein